MNSPVSSSTWPKQLLPISTPRTPDTAYSAAVRACTHRQQMAAHTGTSGRRRVSRPGCRERLRMLTCPSTLPAWPHLGHRQAQAAIICAAAHRHLLPPGLGTAPGGCVAASVQRPHTRHARPVAPRWAHRRHAAVPPAAQSACRGPQPTERSTSAAGSAHGHFGGKGGLQLGKVFLALDACVMQSAGFKLGDRCQSSAPTAALASCCQPKPFLIQRASAFGR